MQTIFAVDSGISLCEQRVDVLCLSELRRRRRREAIRQVAKKGSHFGHVEPEGKLLQLYQIDSRELPIADASPARHRRLLVDQHDDLRTCKLSLCI